MGVGWGWVGFGVVVFFGVGLGVGDYGGLVYSCVRGYARGC